MRVALIVLQLKLSNIRTATEAGISADVSHALGAHGGVHDWPEGNFYYVGSVLGQASRVKRVRFIDIPEGS